MGVYSRIRLFNMTLPAIGADLLSQDIQPIFDMSEFRIHIAVSKAAKLTMKRKEISTGTSITENLSSQVFALDEGVTYTVPTRAIEKYNFSLNVSTGTLWVLQIDEVAQ